MAEAQPAAPQQSLGDRIAKVIGTAFLTVFASGLGLIALLLIGAVLSVGSCIYRGGANALAYLDKKTEEREAKTEEAAREEEKKKEKEEEERKEEEKRAGYANHVHEWLEANRNNRKSGWTQMDLKEEIK